MVLRFLALKIVRVLCGAVGLVFCPSRIGAVGVCRASHIDPVLCYEGIGLFAGTILVLLTVLAFHGRDFLSFEALGLLFPKHGKEILSSFIQSFVVLRFADEAELVEILGIAANDIVYI